MNYKLKIIDKTELLYVDVVILNANGAYFTPDEGGYWENDQSQPSCWRIPGSLYKEGAQAVFDYLVEAYKQEYDIGYKFNEDEEYTLVMETGIE